MLCITQAVLQKWFKTIPLFGSSKGQEASIFYYDYFVNTEGSDQGPAGRSTAISPTTRAR